MICLKDSYIGEDRNFGGSELFVDLIPRSCWFTNVRYCVGKEDWDKIKKKVYLRIGYTCECCFINCIREKIQIEAHERWEFDYTTFTQKLVRFVGLCRPCHQVTHLGFSKMKGIEDIALAHLKQIRNFNMEELQEHVDNAWSLWNERNQHIWELDLSLITTNGFEIIKPIPKENRSCISKEKISNNI